jgi:hypothetical protein
MYLIAFPLLLIPFVLFNMVLFILNMPFSDTMFSIPLAADRRLSVTTGDVIVMVGMLLLYLEVVKAARLGSKGFVDHLLSLILFAAMACELALVPQAATPTLLLLTVLAFVDVITGVSIGRRARRREIEVEALDH